MFCFTNTCTGSLQQILGNRFCAQNYIWHNFNKISAQKLICFGTKIVGDIDPTSYFIQEKIKLFWQSVWRTFHMVTGRLTIKLWFNFWQKIVDKINLQLLLHNITFTLSAYLLVKLTPYRASLHSIRADFQWRRKGCWNRRCTNVHTCSNNLPTDQNSILKKLKIVITKFLFKCIYCTLLETFDSEKRGKKNSNLAHQ